MSVTIRKHIAPYWWRLDKDAPESSEFFIRPLTQLQFIDVRNETKFSGKRLSTSSAGIKTLLEHGLLGWRGVIDEERNELEFSRDQVDQLPMAVLQAIASEVCAATLLTETERKN